METLDVRRASDWHSWLRENHLRQPGVWLVFHKMSSDITSISYDEALDEALIFGWIDSIIRKLDDQSYVRKFTPRRPWSIWSRRNIARVETLSKMGRMTKWGLEAYAKRTSEVSLLERFNAEGVIIPADFESALRKNEVAWSNFQRLTTGYRKKYLIWITGAKRPETRQKRIVESVVLISKGVKDLLK